MRRRIEKEIQKNLEGVVFNKVELTLKLELDLSSLGFQELKSIIDLQNMIESKDMFSWDFKLRNDLY